MNTTDLNGRCRGGRRVIALVLALVAGAVAQGEDLKAQMLREQKPSMVLYIGSDWCVSGNCVRRVFESPAFRDQFKGRWLFGVHDQWDGPCPAAVSNENARVQSLQIGVKRYPALCLFDAKGQMFACLENLPYSVKAKGLAARVVARNDVRRKAEACFAAKKYGAGLDLISAQVSDFFQTRRRRGKTEWTTVSYTNAWQALNAADPEDKEGWRLHFTMGDGIGDVTKANGYATSTNFVGGTNFIAQLRKRPMKHCTVEQRQSVDMAEFALLRRDTNATARCTELLRKIHSANPRSLWGWAAYGFLKERNIEVTPAQTNAAFCTPLGVGVIDRTLRPCGTVAVAPGTVERLAKPIFARVQTLLKQGETKTPEEAAALVRARVLRQVTTNTVEQVLAREGGAAFVEKFFGDPAWMEDFCASGPVGDYRTAFTNLAVFAWNEPLVRQPGVPRRIATALALNSVAKVDTLMYFRALEAYIALWEAGRLHKASLGQSVREWRFAVDIVHGVGVANILWLNYFYNVPYDTYGNAFRFVPYRMWNCFGEYIHKPQLYWGPWKDCPWPTMKMKQRVGGVCGVLSSFGAYTTNAHGLPAMPGGQPGHCIFNRRAKNGLWTIHNYISRFSTARFHFWDAGYTMLNVVERSFADRTKQLAAERFIWLAHFAEDAQMPLETLEALYRRAVAAHPQHYGVWDAFARMLVRQKATAPHIHQYLKDLVVALPDGRQATWRAVWESVQGLVKQPEGRRRVTEELEPLYANLPAVTNTWTREEVNFGGVLQGHLRLVQRPPLRRRLLEAALAAQPTVNDFYLQSLRACSFENDLDLFQVTAADFDRRSPVPANAACFPTNDFGGALISAKGMLKPSSSGQHWRSDHPELYARAIGPLKVLDPARPKIVTAFQTRGERTPWVQVRLPQVSEVTGILLTNPSGRKAKGLTPFVVSVSVDGKRWKEVYRTTDVQAVYRIPLAEPARAVYVRVARIPSDSRAAFSIGKFLVYGRAAGGHQTK